MKSLIYTKYALSFLFVLLLVSNASCKDKKKKNDESNAAETTSTVASSEENQKKFPIIKFESTEHDFGEIKRSVPVSYIFKFKNVGNAPLVIADATSSCGCTVPEKPKNPILPNATGEIKVNYNASGSGNITKIVTLVTNTKEGREQLKIQALVK